MTNPYTVEAKIREIFSFGFTDPAFINDMHVLVGKERIETAVRQLKGLLVDARLDELNQMKFRVMDDPEDDTNLFWYRTYTKPEFEDRISSLQQTRQEEVRE